MQHLCFITKAHIYSSCYSTESVSYRCDGLATKRLSSVLCKRCKVSMFILPIYCYVLKLRFLV